MAPMCTVAYMDKYICEEEEVRTPSWPTLAAEIHVAMLPPQLECCRTR